MNQTQSLYISANFYAVIVATHKGSCELPIGFYTFNIYYIFMHSMITKTKNSMTELELEKQLALYPLSELVFISCVKSFLIL